MYINDILTIAEASELWGLNDSTLRKSVLTSKFIEAIDYRKSGSTWLITKSAMIKVYGNLEDTNIKDSLLRLVRQYYNFKVEGIINGDLEIVEYELLNIVNKVCNLKLKKLEKIHYAVTKYVYDTKFMIGNVNHRTAKDILNGIKDQIEKLTEEQLKNIFVDYNKK